MKVEMLMAWSYLLNLIEKMWINFNSWWVNNHSFSLNSVGNDATTTTTNSRFATAHNVVTVTVVVMRVITFLRKIGSAEVAIVQFSICHLGIVIVD